MVIDTNILIAHLSGDKSTSVQLEKWLSDGPSLFISIISKIEVLSLPGLTETQISNYNLYLNSFITVPINEAIVKEAAKLRRHYRMRLPDAIIAATSITYRVPLVTRDRGFSKIKEIQIVG